MKIKWLLVISIVLLAILAPVSAADDIVVTTEAVKDKIPYDGTLRYVITITNNQDYADKFLFSSTPSQLGQSTLWSFKPQTVSVPSGGSEDVVFDLTPPKDIRVGTYGLDIIVYSSTDTSIKGYSSIRFEITSEYPHLEATIEMPGELYPGTLPVSVIIENDGAKTQDNLTAVFESELFGAYDLEIGSLNPGETRLVLNEEVEIPTSTEPGYYTSKVVFYKNGEFVDETEKDITVFGKGNLAVSHDIKKGILTNKYSVTLTNVGNAESNEKWNADFASWKRILVKSNPEQLDVIVTDGTATFEWPIILQPGESTTINYQISYSPILATILALLFFVYVVYWYFGEAFSLKKEARKTKGHIEVKLLIKNKTPEIQHNIIIEDMVPTPLKLVKEFGTKTPTAIKKLKSGTKMSWKFRHLGPFEEVILTYGIKSRLSVVGTLTLPAAVLKAKVGKSLKKFYSNSFSLTGKVSVKEEEPEEQAF
ncbi:hypothetical protein GF374_00060 [Candidatus Woesearchaeota archaeon]|nr:hypothetical protein [Candidatus Woesearchaeota archaeon]